MQKWKHEKETDKGKELEFGRKESEREGKNVRKKIKLKVMQKWIESKEIWETTKDVENVARENSTMGTTQKKNWSNEK